MVQREIRVGMSLDAFLEQYHDQPFELRHGEQIALSPNISGHQWVARNLFRRLDAYLHENSGGEVLWETPFILRDEPDWVKGSYTPDLAVYVAHRWDTYTADVPDWKEKPVVLVPDLVVEIVSPNDRYTEINDKVDNYLLDGVQSVWVIDPQRRKVVISRADSELQTTLRETGTLTDATLLPGLNIPIRSLFE